MTARVLLPARVAVLGVVCRPAAARVLVPASVTVADCDPEVETVRVRVPARGAGAGTFALSKLIVHEKAESWIREPFVDEEPSGRRPKGRRLRYAVGELLTCTRCTGAWSALGLVALRLHAPATGRTVAAVLAASAGSDMLHASFKWLCAGANATVSRSAA